MLFNLSCTKNISIPSSVDEVATELRKVISNNKLTRVHPIIRTVGFPNQFSANAGVSWSFANGFIKTQGYVFDPAINLNYLTSYTISLVRLDYGSLAVALLFYFNY
jgi:hypothetical protein